MKNLITTIASLMLILVFMLQFTSNQVLHNNLIKIDKEINSFQQIIKKDGYITNYNSNNLKTVIADIIDCNEEEITISGTKSPLTKGNLISYEISIPMKDLICAPEFWKIEKNNNANRLEYKQTTVSELIDRSKNW